MALLEQGGLCLHLIQIKLLLLQLVCENFRLRIHIALGLGLDELGVVNLEQL